MSRSSSVDVVNTISIVSGSSAVKDINEVTDMPSAVSLTTTPQVATSPPHSRITENSDSAPDTPDSSTTCSWCRRTGGSWEPGSSLSCTAGITSNAGKFCSEACFAAGRRAAFKRARTCDWCRHLRHSVSYVDFQDGENQLQFCSDKCLNQYKMNIFCRETQAYLALHGLTSISSTSNQSIGDGLITPELWLRDCQSPQSSSLDDEALVVDDEPMNWSSDCGLDNEERDRLASGNNSSVQNSPAQTPNNKQIKSEEKDSEDSSMQDFQEETIKLAIKESLKDEEYRRCKARKEEMDSFKSFSVCVESRIPPSNLPTNNTTVKTCRRSKSSPESLKASPLHSDSSRKGTIFIKDVRKLLRRDPEKGRNSIHRTECRIPSNNTITTHNSSAATNKLPVSFHLPQIHSSQSLPREFFPTFHQSFTPPHQVPLRFNLNSNNTSIPSISSPNIGMRPKIPVNSFHTKTSPTNPQFSLLPPVTVLVPYPIPIPIPLPIPIPQSVFEKFFNSKNSSKQSTEKENDTSSNLDNPTFPQDLSQRSKLKNAQSSNCFTEQNLSIKADKLSTLSDSSTSSSTSAPSTLSTKQSPFSSFITDSPRAASALPVLPITLSNDIHEQRSSRKRKHLQSESLGELDLRLKRKNKFVPV